MTLIFCRKRKIIDFILFIMIKLEIYNLIILGQIRKEDIMIVREDRKHMEIDLSPCIDPNVFEKIKIIYVVKLETSISSIHRIRTTGSPLEWSYDRVTRFSSADCIFKNQDENGIRLLEEIVRRLQYACDTTFKEYPDLIVVSTPGTIQKNQIIARASRLGITEPINVADFIQNALQTSVLVISHTDSRAAGEIYFGEHASADRVIRENLDFAVIMVEEGVGMSLVQNWRITRGAGAAGAIGRLVVEPNGQFNRFYNQRGNLETCIAIPWLSRSIIEEYLIQNDKQEHTDQLDKQLLQQIQGAIKKEKWESINMELIDQALKNKDPIVLTVMQRAAIYLARIISAIIAINNPYLIILTGEVVEKSEAFFDMVKRETRKLSWGKAWERTTISKAASQKEYEVLGASYIGYKFCQEELT